MIYKEVSLSNNGNISIKVLGARGSMPIHRADCMEFGGATSCFYFESENRIIYLDAGTGLIGRDAIGDETDIILSHLHMDHIAGLPGYHGLSDPDHKTTIYVPDPDSTSSGIQSLRDIYMPPLWPLGLEEYPGQITIKDCKPSFEIGPFLVRTSPGHHPDGCIVITLETQGKKIVYATDYEHDGNGDAALIEASRDADLLIYDGAYLPEEYPRFRSFGHSTPADGIRIATAAGAKKLLITHHMTERDDSSLREIEDNYRSRFADIRFARQGDSFKI